MKPDSFDAHRVLEIPPDADEAAIRRAFRRLAKMHHPDQQGGNARQFNLICRAYRQLIGITNREIFPPPKPGVSGRHHMDDLALDLEQVAHGEETTYRYLRQTPCGHCRIRPKDDCQICLGSGVVYQMRHGRYVPEHCPRCTAGRSHTLCPECKGSGLIPMLSDVRLDLPPGLSDRQYLRIPGQGHYPPPPRSLPGDLYLRIRIRSHRLFVPRDRDLHLWWDRPPWPTSQPDLVPTLYGPVRLSRIPSPGRVIRVPDKGLPKLGGTDRGRLYVHY